MPKMNVTLLTRRGVHWTQAEVSKVVKATQWVVNTLKENMIVCKEVDRAMIESALGHSDFDLEVMDVDDPRLPFRPGI